MRIVLRNRDFWDLGPSTAEAEVVASKLPPQHHEIAFGLTQKGNFSYSPAPKTSSYHVVLEEATLLISSVSRKGHW
jgi:hypothetical protein